MRKLPLIVLGIAVLALAGIFVYVAFMEVPVAQKEVVKPISNDRFFGKS